MIRFFCINGKSELLLTAVDIYIFCLLYVVLQDLTSFLSLWHCCILAKVSFFTGLQSTSVESVTSDTHWISPPSVVNSFCTDPFGCLLFPLCQYFLLISCNKIYFCIIESIKSAVSFMTSHLGASHMFDLDESRSVYFFKPKWGMRCTLVSCDSNTEDMLSWRPYTLY